MSRPRSTAACPLSATGSGARGGPKAQYDQQPIEATALLLAAEAAYRVAGQERHRLVMERAYGWFLGGNDLGLDVADPVRGAGYDGLTPDGINTNQGAESTLMWLTAAEHIRAMRRERATEFAEGPAHLSGLMSSRVVAAAVPATP